MNARVTGSADLRNIATTSSVKRLVRSVVRERPALEFQIIELCANVRRVTLDLLLVNADQNATEMSIVPDHDQLVTMESARALAMELAALALTVISVA